jgi:hypothetical protein
VSEFQPTKRDGEILRAIYSYRALSTPQIDALFFAKGDRAEGSRVSSRCLHRLKLLFHAGYVRRKEQAQTLSDGRKPLVYFLDWRGARHVADLDECDVKDLDWDRQGHEVGSLFLDHLLLSHDVRIAMRLAAPKHNCELVEWHDERTLRGTHKDEKVKITGKKGTGQYEVLLIPDGYFVLHTPDSFDHFFLEIDRGTEPLYATDLSKRAWWRKIAAYLVYYKSHAYFARYGTTGLRILTVTTSEQRLANLKQITEEAGGKSRFWFTTTDRITPAAILTEPIWYKATFDGKYTLLW